ncbi:MAG TPA: carboxypeptidase regulatory-like domain-containing protein [Kofleriaceae bacterium]
MSILCWSGLVLAQSATHGAIYGVATDADSGEALAGVTVVASSSASAAQTAITDDKGAYKINDLAPGEYVVTFYYLDAVVERTVPVGVQKVTPVYQKIDTKAAKGEVVRIEGKTPAIDPTSTAQGITIDKNYLKNIPVPGRTFEAALGAAAGSQGDRLGVAFSGSTSLENQYYVDGVNTTSLTFGTVGSPIINDFIEEIEIITGGYNAEYGRATGGIVNVVTKSGSNEFKGSVFGTWQPSFLTAETERTPRNAASLDVTADIGYRADFGFELGGPIVKDRLWFYVGFAPAFVQIDYTRETKRQKDCHEVSDEGELSDCNPELNANGGFADTNPDIDPVTGYFLTETLDSEIRTRNQQIYNLLGKINYAPTPEQQGQLAITAQPGGGRSPGIFGPANTGYTDEFLTLDVSAKWTAKFNDGKTEVEGLIGMHRDSFSRSGIDPTLESDPLQLLVNKDLGTLGRGFGESMATVINCTDGFPGSADTYPFITNCPMNNRVYAIGGPGSLYDNVEDRRSARLGVTQRVKAGGTHELKAGIDVENNVTRDTRSLSGGAQIVNYVNSQVDIIRWVQVTNMEDMNPRFDRICGSPAPSTDPMAPTEFKCDYLASEAGAPGTIIGGNTLNWSAYIRDSWQIKPNLTLNAGLRLEEQRLRYADFLQNQVNPITGDYTGKNALVLKGQFAPRVGLLYDWTKEGRSKAYAHWGRFYESIPMEINGYNFGNPVLYVQSYTPGRCGGMTDDRIGGYNGSDCLETTERPDLRQELFGANGSLVAPGVKGQYLDEVVAGVELEVMDDLKLGVSFQDRRFGRVIEDVSLDNANTYVVANPGEWSSEEEKKLEEQIARETDPTAKARLMRNLAWFRGIRIFDRPRRDYDALQFTMTRRFSKNVYTQGSYTYSRTRGNYPGLVNYDDNLTLPNNSTQYDLIELLANRLGPLPQDRPHYIKLDGYYTFDLKKAGLLTTGIRFRALSGQPRNALAPHYLYGDSQSFLMPRGRIGRADFEHGLDVHISYARKLQVAKREWGGELFLNVYNIYNNQGVAAVDNEYSRTFKQGTSLMTDATRQNANPVSGGTYEDLIWVKTIDRQGVETNDPIGRNPNFGNTTGRYAPFYLQLGARLTF